MYSQSVKTRRLFEVDWRNPINSNHPLNQGRLGWWLVTPNRFGGPVWWDLTGSYSASLNKFTSGFGWNPNSYTNGGGSLEFASGSNQVDMGLWTQFNEVPIATWAFSFCLLNSTAGRILTKWGGSSVRSFDFEIIAGPKLQVALDYDGIVIVYNPATVLSVGTWYRCVTAMKSGSAPQIYLNGNLVLGTGTAATKLLTSTSHVQLGFESASLFNSANMFANDISLLPGTYWPPSLVTLDYQLSQQGYPGVLNRRKKTVWFLQAPPSPPPATSSKPIAAYTRRGVVIGTGIF